MAKLEPHIRQAMQANGLEGTARNVRWNREAIEQFLVKPDATQVLLITCKPFTKKFAALADASVRLQVFEEGELQGIYESAHPYLCIDFDGVARNVWTEQKHLLGWQYPVAETCAVPGTRHPRGHDASGVLGYKQQRMWTYVGVHLPIDTNKRVALSAERSGELYLITRDPKPRFL